MTVSEISGFFLAAFGDQVIENDRSVHVPSRLFHVPYRHFDGLGMPCLPIVLDNGLNHPAEGAKKSGTMGRPATK
jgi:hypothetical protein